MELSNSIKREFKQHVQDAIDEGRITLYNQNDWHQILFNNDYYIVGYYEASEWINRHSIDLFEAISTCIEYEKNNFGEVLTIHTNAETTVNMLTYILGEAYVYAYESDIKNLF